MKKKGSFVSNMKIEDLYQIIKERATIISFFFFFFPPTRFLDRQLPTAQWLLYSVYFNFELSSFSAAHSKVNSQGKLSSVMDGLVL